MPDDRDRPDQVNATLLVAHRLGEINEQLRLHNNNQAILARLAEMESKIMSAISDYTDAVDAKFSEIGTSVDELVTSVAGVTGDVATLKELILKLENNPGQISTEDQALLTKSVATVTSLADRTKAIAAAAKELDAATETPPTPPVEP